MSTKLLARSAINSFLSSHGAVYKVVCSARFIWFCNFFVNWYAENILAFLNPFLASVFFYTPWKCQKTSGFLTFSGGIEINVDLKWVKFRLDFSRHLSQRENWWFYRKNFQKPQTVMRDFFLFRVYSHLFFLLLMDL